jgi:hypothetical protein
MRSYACGELHEVCEKAPISAKEEIKIVDRGKQLKEI